MKRIARSFIAILLWTVALVPFSCFLFVLATPYAQTNLPPLRDGDIVFQTINTSQTLAILFATHSIYSHVGIVHMDGGTPMVIEAVGPVREISLDAWVRQGIGERITIGRVDGLTPVQAQAVIAQAKRYLGRPYDFFFLPGEDAIYCSELVHKAFAGGAAIEVGKEEKVGELYVDNAAVRRIIHERWQRYPLCNGVTDFTRCYDTIMAQTLVSPASQRRDPGLRIIYSNMEF